MLRADKELIVFPLVAFVGSIIVTMTFAIPMALTRMLEDASRGSSQVTLAILAFLFYLVQYTIIFFANSALVGAAMIRLKGGDPTLGDGFRIASQHLGSILGYALIASTVGMILRWLSERGLLGRIVSSLFGLAWNIATYLVVPILVVEGIGPIEAVKRSTQLLKKTWGEQIVGNLGIGAVFGLITVVAVLLFIPIMIAVASAQSIGVFIFIIALFVTALIALGLIGSALNGIYTAAVYRYATEGETGSYFDRDLVQNAFRAR